MEWTQSNRGWEGLGCEQVNPTQNPDYKNFLILGWSLIFQSDSTLWFMPQPMA